ncbi:uncharacterized protein LOC111365524 isoform X2 [Olea europaea var. sylvestris]|uniref:uncharacterized protein LOC111365524 isoform X2 n=1 Tax=Olea europaea var. sylvestris TaxID=158386 RepID=UPI000C1D7FA4|nr:uncharacterized protein LOC111365524 isoform X2 [Olea europaea var. sylvestris]
MTRKMLMACTSLDHFSILSPYSRGQIHERGGGPIMADLWALKGVIEEGRNETPGWTQLKLPGQAPSPYCGHTITSGGHYLLLFGGRGTGGWLSHYDVYHNDCLVLDRGDPIAKRISPTEVMSESRNATMANDGLEPRSGTKRSPTLINNQK